MLLLFALPLIGGGCIRKETTHTVYLDPEGGATWTILEQEIRSDEDSTEGREKEERKYMQSVRMGEHDGVLALDRLGAEWVDWRVLRDERPYMVFVEGRFAALDLAIQSFFDELSAPAASPVYADVQQEGDCARLVISCDFELLDQLENSEQAGSEDDETEVLLSLVGDVHRVVLTEGRFTEATGFELNDDGTAARLLERSREEIEAAAQTDEYGNLVVYSLAWSIPKGR
jgi:hypothetical protein